MSEILKILSAADISEFICWNTQTVSSGTSLCYCAACCQRVCSCRERLFQMFLHMRHLKITVYLTLPCIFVYLLVKMFFFYCCLDALNIKHLLNCFRCGLILRITSVGSASSFLTVSLFVYYPLIKFLTIMRHIVYLMAFNDT